MCLLICIRVCQRCIRRMDHHCVFVNNCVGENNQKSFILFMVTTRGPLLVDTELLRNFNPILVLHLCYNALYVHRGLCTVNQLRRLELDRSVSLSLPMYTLKYNSSSSLHPIECPAWFPPVTLVLGLVLIIVTASFAIFTAIMTCIQLYCIHADITVTFDSCSTVLSDFASLEHRVLPKEKHEASPTGRHLSRVVEESVRRARWHQLAKPIRPTATVHDGG